MRADGIELEGPVEPLLAGLPLDLANMVSNIAAERRETAIRPDQAVFGELPPEVRRQRLVRPTILDPRAKPLNEFRRPGQDRTRHRLFPREEIEQIRARRLAEQPHVAHTDADAPGVSSDQQAGQQKSSDDRETPSVDIERLLPIFRHVTSDLGLMQVFLFHFRRHNTGRAPRVVECLASIHQ